MASIADWKAIEEQILNALDIKTLYEGWGVRFTRDTPNASGWLPCYAVGRSETTPSAAVNIGPGPARGRYSDKGGPGTNLNLWGFATAFGSLGKDWREARTELGNRVGIKLPDGREPVHPGTRIRRCADSPYTLKRWTDIKGGITVQACQEAGAFCCIHPGNLDLPLSDACIALPGYGPGMLDVEPVGYVLYQEDGNDLRLFKGKDKAPDLKRILVVKDSQSCILNKFALERIADGRATFVWKVEGPSDMLSLQSIIPPDLKDSHVVITNAFGAVESIQEWWLRLVHGKKVGLIGDCDTTGQVGVSKWMSYLERQPVIEYKYIQLPYPIMPSHGKDLRDWIKEGHTYTDLLNLYDAAAPGRMLASSGTAHPAPTMHLPPAAPVPAAPPAMASAAPPLLPPPPPPVSPAPPAGPLPPTGAPSGPTCINEDAILKELQLHVLGHFPDCSVEIFSWHMRQTHRITNPAKLAYDELLIFCGTLARDKVHEGRDEIPGVYRLAKVKNAIAVVSGHVNLVDAVPIGQGVWRADTEIVLINGPSASMVHDDGAAVTLNEVLIPRCGRHVIDFGGEPWCDLPLLRSYLAAAHDPLWCQASILQLTDLLHEWCWRHRTDAEIATSLVIATWMQTVWSWRPIVSLTGPSNTGKSTLIQDLLCKLFGHIALYINKPTEAGVRQHMRNHACALLLDECESDVNRVRLQEMLRATSRGGEILRGSADQRGRKYRIQHLPWMAAIESGLSREADKNRVIELELQRFPGGSHLSLPSTAELADLGLRLLAIGLRHIRNAMLTHTQLKESMIEGAHPRLVETYAVPASIHAEVFGLSSGDALALLTGWLHGRDQGAAAAQDEQDLLKSILESFVDTGISRRRSVVQLLQSSHLYTECSESLASHGIIITCIHDSARPRPAASIHSVPAHDLRIFINPGAVRRFLLQRTRWQELDIGQILFRIPGAVRVRRRIDSKRTWGVEIPYLPWLDPEDTEPSLASLVADIQDP